MDGPPRRTRALVPVAIAVAVAILAVSAPAVADDSPYLAVPIEASTSQWFGPPLALNGGGVSSRFIGTSVPSATQLYGGSIALDLDGLHNGDSLGISETLLRLRISSSSSSAPTTETVGGAPVTVTRGPETLVEVGFPLIGQGAIYPRDHFALRFGLEGGWAYLMSSASVTSASGASASGSANAGSFYFRTPVAACVLEHPFGSDGGVLRNGEDVCLTFAPMIYEFGWFQGWSAGLRVDL